MYRKVTKLFARKRPAPRFLRYFCRTKSFLTGKYFFQSNNNQPKNYEAEVNSGSLVRKLHGFRRIVRPGSDGKRRGGIFRHDNFDIGRNDSEHPLGNHPWAPGHRHLPAGIGYHSKVCVKEGEVVRQGQLLFIIDQVPYKAALQTAKANVAAAEASVATAQLTYDSKKSCSPRTSFRSSTCKLPRTTC